MIQDLLKEVLLVEEDMRAILNEAREFGNQIRDTAEAQARSIPKRAREEAEAEAERRIAQARERSEHLRQVTLEEARSEAEALRQKAEEHIPEAVDFVISQVTRTEER